MILMYYKNFLSYKILRNTVCTPRDHISKADVSG